MRAKQDVARSAIVLSFAEAFNVLCGIALVIAIARVLGTSSLGLFSFAFSIGAILSIVSLYGINDFIIREVSRAPEASGGLFRNLLASRVAIASTLVAASVVIFYMAGYSGSKMSILCVIILTRILDSFLFTFYAFFRAFQKFLYEGIFRFFLNVVTLAAGLVSLFICRDMLVFSIVYCAAVALFVIAGFMIVRKIVSGNRAPFSIAGCYELVRKSYSFSLVSILLVLYVQINTTLLMFMKGEDATGVYSAAFRFVSAFGFIALGFVNAAFPLMSRMDKDKEGLYGVYAKAEKYLFIMALFLSITLCVFARELIFTVYGANLADAVLPLVIMSVTPVFMFMNAGNTYLIFALNKEKTYLAVLATVILAAIPLNIVLLPAFGAVGAAITTLVPEMMLCALFLRVIYSVFKKNIFSVVMRPAAAGVIAVAVTFLLRGHIVPVYGLIMCWAIFAAGLFVSGVFTKGEIDMVKSIFMRRAS